MLGDIPMRLNTARAALAGRAFRFGSEVQLHDLLERLLIEAGLRVEREVQASPTNRLDFYLPDLRIAVEVKVDGGLSAALSQSARYVRELDTVDGVLLASTCAWGRKPIPALVDAYAGRIQLMHLARQSL